MVFMESKEAVASRRSDKELAILGPLALRGADASVRAMNKVNYRGSLVTPPYKHQKCYHVRTAL